MTGCRAPPCFERVSDLKWGRLKVLFFVILDFYLAFYEIESRVVDLGLKDSGFAKIFPSSFILALLLLVPEDVFVFLFVNGLFVFLSFFCSRREKNLILG